MIQLLLILAQLAMTQIKDTVEPKYPAEATAFRYERTVSDKESQKVVAAVEALRLDKQVVGKNPPYVYAVIVRGLDKGNPVDVFTSGSFATKEDALAWFETLKKKAAEVPEILPKEATFTLHTCDHSPQGNGKGGCKEEEIKP